jgi:hypothetical protein
LPGGDDPDAEAQEASKSGPSNGRPGRAEPLAGPTRADAEAAAMSPVLVFAAIIIAALAIQALLEVLLSGRGPLSR